MTETQERFLRAVAARLPLDRVAEVHLFPSIRQGGVETGVAVIAVEAEGGGDAPASAEVSPGAALSGAALSGAEGEDAAPDGVTDAAGAGEGARNGSAAPPTAPAAIAEPAIAEPATAETATAGENEPAGAGGAGDSAAGAPPQHQDSADAPDASHRSAARHTDSPPAPRHTIFSARYRLTLKGPDRGRWEAEVVAEADAPLATADLVVRGVRKRTGEAAEAERVSPDALRQLAAQPA